MKYLLLPFAFLLGFLNAHAQILDPVKWSFDQRSLGNNQYELIFKATIQKGWAIYSPSMEEGGPVPTSFTYEEGPHFQLSGKVAEAGHRKEGFDKIFEMEVIKFTEEATFTQKVKVNDINKPIKGYLTFMTCDDTRCLPPTDVDYAFTIKAAQAPTGTAGTTSASAQPATPPATSPQQKPQEKPKTTTGTTPASNPAPTAEKEVIADVPAPVSNTKAPKEVLQPVQWTAKLVPATAEGTFDLILNAHVEDGWYIYSQFLEKGGPEPTAFLFPENTVQTVGDPRETGEHRIAGHDPIFEMEVVKYKKDVQFIQTLQAGNGVSEGEIAFMACNDEECIFPEPQRFSIDWAAGTVSLEGQEKPLANAPLGTAELQYGLPLPGDPVGECAAGSGAVIAPAGKGLWNIFFLGFIGGLLALLTPCVFPMIPLTVSFFTKGSKDRKKGISQAIMYGGFIFMTYLLLSIPFHLLDSINSDILNDISTNVYLNVAFFVIFVFFAFSFFGYYELTLPSSWANKASSAEGIGGMLGIFFMALTLAIVSFSCTGPILGSLLAGAMSSDGGAWQLTAGMGGFGFALALPFALFAAFPSWLKSLPKSGGWLNTVKVVLGFLELALAFKFLSNADLVKKWGLLKIEPFLLIWAVIGVGLALYLFGLLRFPHDSKLKKLGIPRLALGLLTVAFTGYLLTGFRYDAQTETFKPLKLLSGLAPPTTYSWLYPKECPGDLDCFKDLEAGLAFAKSINKPVMLDFTGHACVNCRKMEEHVWPEQDVHDYLKNKYVVISLYVDEKIELPAAEQKEVNKSSGGTRTLRTVGNKWSHFQTENFNANTQPFYVLLSPDGKLLNSPVGYTPDAQEYANFLQCGIDNFQRVNNGANVLGAR